MCETSGRLDGKTVIVTGGSSGMGFEAAKNLASRGARIILASRNETKLIRARDQIRAATGNEDISYRTVDLASLKSVRKFASETVSLEKSVDVLINNAGAVLLPDKLTEDGLALTMQVNYFGTFLLTFLLLPMLKASAPSRIVTGTAASMYLGEIDFDHWNDVGRYNPIQSLSNSKLADVLFSTELSKRLEGTGVTSNSYDPFVVRDTEIFNDTPELIKHVSQFFINIVGQPREEVGQQIAYLAAEPTLEKESGMVYKFCHKWMNHWLASDTELTKKLWEESKKLVKITPEEDWEANTV